MYVKYIWKYICKNKNEIALVLFLILMAFGIININYTYATNESSDYVSLYSTTNKPEFYGLTKAIIQINTDFDIKMAQFRIFAKDFEDGDLTPNIEVVSNNVNTKQIGNYEVVYKVTDSHNNTTNITVPIEVVDNDEGNYYERTLYSLPSIPDGNITGPRGKYMDRQITGFMLEEGTTINIKKISGPDLTANIYSDSASYDSSTINATGVDITASKVSTVFFMTPYDAVETPIVGITIKKDDIIDMPYYHYKDDEQAFRNYWASLQQKGTTVGLIEGYSIAYYLLPTDTPSGFKSFKTIDEGLEFFDKLTNEYDELLGFEYDADKPWNQNVKMRYFITGGGANNGLYAYFTNNQVVLAGSTTPSSNAFCIGWAIMHEIGHGYQGAALKEDTGMGLLEVSGNILAYYAQNKSDFQDEISGNWLGEISSKEVSVNNARLNGKTFRNLDSSSKLYVLVNLLDTYDYKKTYSYLASMSRKLYYEGKISNYNLADRYTLTFHELYGVNVSSYFEAWGETVSQNVKQKLKDDESLVILSDVINDQTLTDSIKETLGLEGKYSLVEQKVLDEYSLKSKLKIKISIDDITNLKGKYIILNGGENTYKVEVTGSEIEVEVNVGNYQATMPVPKVNTYSYDAYKSVNVVNNKDNELSIEYIENTDDIIGLDTEIYLSGQGSFANIKFDSQNIKITTTGDVTHWYWGTDQDYAYINIYDENGNLVYEKHYVGATWTTAGVDTIPYKKGYKIEIFHDEGAGENRIKIVSKYTNEIISNLTHIKGVNTYYIGEYGLYQDEENYDEYLALIDQYASKLVTELTAEEITNKELKTTEKSILLASINKLKDKDKTAYLEKYNYIFNGSSPKLNTDTITLNIGSSNNIYNLITANDIEDGNYELNSTNFKYDSFETTTEGVYEVNYTLSDLDNNITADKLTVIIKKDKDSDNSEANNTVDNNVSNNTTTDTVNNNVSNSTSSNIVNNNTSNSTSSNTVNNSTSNNTVNNNTNNKVNNSTSNNTVNSNESKEETTTNSINNSSKETTVEKQQNKKKSFIDKWTDDEYTFVEIIIFIGIILSISLILAYLNKIFY
jgi:hypothetical protein